MSEPKFKVGDRVYGKGRRSGVVADVMVNPISRVYLVLWDRDLYSTWVFPENLKLADAFPAATLPSSSEARKDVPLFRGLIRYFPAALAWTARISKLGNEKHNGEEDLHHARGKSSDHADCILRHMMDLDADYGKGKGRDENGVPQAGYVVWRALALCQEWLEANDGAPLAPGAKSPKEESK